MLRTVFLCLVACYLVRETYCSCSRGLRNPDNNGCSYEGGFLEPGESSEIRNCFQCSCSKESELTCCQMGQYYTRYPDTCKIVYDANGCEKLVFKSNPQQECTDGPVAAVL